MSKTDTCLKCGQVGHTSSSCKRLQCVACDSFRMTAKSVIYRCVKAAAYWSPSPTQWRDCKLARPAAEGVEAERRAALRDQGSVTA
jgi:hypothetical protein